MTCARALRLLPVLVLAGVGIAVPSAGSSSARAPVAAGASSTASAVSASAYHTCALTSAGGAKCWGNNGAGQLGDGTTTDRHTPVDVTGLTSGDAAVTAGDLYTCAVTSAGGAKCWGANGDGQLGDGTTNTIRHTPVDVSGLASGVTAITADTFHTCALTSTGGAKCWGYNGLGQLGDGTTTNSSVPVDVSGLTSGVAAVAVGYSYSCALTSAGGVKCWGANNAGQLGDGTTTRRYTPVDVSGLGSGVVAVSAGGGHTCALTSVGGVKCWGANNSGELGDGTTTERHTPVNVSGLTSGVAAISGGGDTCALTSAGGVKCWGWNKFGQLGDGTTTDRHTPVSVFGLTRGAAAVSVGGLHTCAVTSGGGVRCWGDNRYGELGDNKACGSPCPTPVQVVGLGRAQCVVPKVTGTKLAAAKRAIRKAHCSVGKVTKAYSKRVKKGRVISQKPKPGKTLPKGSKINLTVSKGKKRSSGVGLTGTTTAAIALGGAHTCALTASGGAKCWGLNDFGQVGANDACVVCKKPVDVSGLTNGVTALAAGDEHTCALTASGRVKCWGLNDAGQLGDGTTTDRSTPVNVSRLTSGVGAIAAGGHHTCALTSAGGAKCWGENFFGQLGDGATTDRSTPANVSGLASGVSAIAAGFSHTCALTASGGVKCWGDNGEGQLGDGTTTNRHTPVDVSGFQSGVSAIAAGGDDAGGDHTCALTAAGGVKCWGRNDSGQLGDGTTAERHTPVDVSGLTSGVSAIAAGGDHTCALTASGGVKCWGDNYSGQLGDGTTTDRSIPVDVSGLTSGVSAIAAGGEHTCALTASGGVKCWGYNDAGQLGDGTITERHTPVNVSGLASGVKCRVPNVKGKKLAVAKRATRKAHCSVGKVTKAYSKRVKKGRVISQKPKPGTTLPAASPVNLKVSEGPHK
jgi:alpha-tubulin suppressor-like RCC1 family protein